MLKLSLGNILNTFSTTTFRPKGMRGLFELRCIVKLKKMSQYSFSYNYDSLNDAFNAVNRKGKMQKRYLSLEYMDAAQKYREMRKKLNEILRKKKAERTEEETSQIDYLKQSMKENARQQKALLQEHLSKVSSRILSSSFRFNLTSDASENPLKPVYSIGATAEEFFAMQVLCRNVKKLLKYPCQVETRYFLS